MQRLTVISANACYGGIDPGTGDDSRARVTIEALRSAQPHVVLFQEMDARDPYRLWRHLRHFASALDMEPVLGPSAAIRSELGNHTAILVSGRRGLRVVDQWPPPAPAGPRVPWCRAEVTVPGLARPVHFCSVHLSARSAADQLRAAQVIASYVRAQHHPAVVGGDFNGYAPASRPPPSRQRCRRTCGASRAGAAAPAACWSRITPCTTRWLMPGSPTSPRTCRPAAVTRPG
jgi:endonuclease/exonuclease/phosphatase family metal-dependent hydrolase